MRLNLLLRFVDLTAFCLAIFCAVALCRLSLVEFSSKFGAPSVSSDAVIVRPRKIEFGDKTEGKISGAFELINCSAIPWKVVSTSVSCNCLVVKIPAAVIGAGESIAASVLWSTVGSYGAIGQRFSIYCEPVSVTPELNSEGEARGVVVHGEVSANIEPPWRTVPTMIDLSNCLQGLTESPDQQLTASIRILPVEGISLSVLSAVITRGSFRPKISIEGLTIRLMFDAYDLSDESYAELTVTTDCVARPLSRVQIVLP